MGWCNGTILFDKAIDCMAAVADDMINWDKAVEALLVVFQEHDWDCETDSLYWDSEVFPAMRRLGQRYAKD